MLELGEAFIITVCYSAQERVASLRSSQDPHHTVHLAAATGFTLHRSGFSNRPLALGSPVTGDPPRVVG